MRYLSFFYIKNNFISQTHTHDKQMKVEMRDNTDIRNRGGGEGGEIVTGVTCKTKKKTTNKKKG